MRAWYGKSGGLHKCSMFKSVHSSPVSEYDGIHNFNITLSSKLGSNKALFGGGAAGVELGHLLNAPPARQQEKKVQPQSYIDVDGFQMELLDIVTITWHIKAQ